VKKTFFLALRKLPNKAVVKTNRERLPDSIKCDAHFACHIEYLTCEAASCLASAHGVLDSAFERKNQWIRWAKMMISRSRGEGR